MLAGALAGWHNRGQGVQRGTGMKELLSDAFPASAWRWGDDYLLEPGRRRLTHDGEPVEVEDRAFDLIALLLQHRERALDKPEVIAAIWGKRPVSDATLRQLVYKARRAVGDDGEQQAVISTMYGRSLQWIAPVEMVFEAVAEPAVPSVTPTADGIGDPGHDSSLVRLPSVAARGRSRLAWFMLVVAGLLVAGGIWFGIAKMRPTTARVAPVSARLVIAPIENATGEAAMDWVGNGLPGLMGGLLGQGGGVEVVDPLRSARLWRYAPQSGRTRAQQLRFATGAGVLVEGKLRKLPGKLYELDLDVSNDDGSPQAITVTGEHPGLLAVDATRRIRRTLNPDAISTPQRVPHDSFVAEAYARGMDLASHGKWNEALTHFELCVQNAPDFLPARLQYGVALYRGDRMELGEKTLLEVVSRAQRQGAGRIAGRAMAELASEATRQQKHAAALAWAMQARALPASRDDPRLQARIAIEAALAHSALVQHQAAHDEAALAKALVVRNHLHDLEPDLYGVQREIAHNTGDIAGEEAADRAQLAANNALGNERGALGSLMGLAQALYDHDQRVEAVQLFQQGYRQAVQLHDAFITVVAGDYLGATLLGLGLDERVGPVADNLMSIARQQHNKAWQGIVLALYGGVAVYHDDAAAQLDYFNQAAALIDAKQDPVNAVGTLLFVAAAAYQAEPQKLQALVKQVDAIVAAQQDRAPFLAPQQLIHALALAHAGDHNAAVGLLHKTADGKSGVALDGNVRMISFLIGRKVRAAASIALAGFDPVHWVEATDLRNYALWAASQGDERARQVAEDRILALRASALRVLSASSSVGPSAVNQARPGASPLPSLRSLHRPAH